MKYTLIILVACSIVYSTTVYSQQLLITPEKERELLIENYYDIVAGNAKIYSGREQAKYLLTIKNHPYFVTDEYSIGEVFYDGISYNNVKLRWDVFRDELIALSLHANNIVLYKDCVDQFDLHGQVIINLKSPDFSDAPATGFYIRLYEGDIDVLGKPVCELVETHQDRVVLRSFEMRKDICYVIYDNTCYRIKSKRAILKLFKSHKKELKQYIRAQRLDFKDDFSGSIVYVVKKYEELTTL